MRFLLFLILACGILFGQTQLDPLQVNWPQTDFSFWRHCSYDSNGIISNYSYQINPQLSRFGTSDPGQMTTLSMNQIIGYGLKISADGSRVWVFSQYSGLAPQWVITAANSMATGTIEYRGGFNLIGIQYEDLTLQSFLLGPYPATTGPLLNGAPGSWFVLNGQYPNPPLATIQLTNGVFTIQPGSFYHNSCELWN